MIVGVVIIGVVVIGFVTIGETNNCFHVDSFVLSSPLSLSLPLSASDLAESMCGVMEQESTTEGGEDKWGRRYASSGLYSLVSSGKYRTALTESGRVALRLKSLLVRKVMFGSFCFYGTGFCLFTV